MKQIAWLVTSWIGFAAMAGAEETVQMLPSPLALPARIGPLQYTGSPHKYDQPALGVSYQYGAGGLSLTIYVYDAGVTDIADGADTIAVCNEFEVAKMGVTGSYQNTQLKSQLLVSLTPPDALPQVREAVYEYEREQHPFVSYLWVTAVAKHFVKLRFSLDPKLRDEIPDARRAVFEALGTAIKPHLAPLDAKAAKPGTSIGFNAFGGSSDDMQASLMYVIVLTTLIDKAPELAPVCGGVVEPDFATEMGVFRGLAGLSGDDSKFAKRILALDAAGFLDEFVWLERYRKSWGKPPEGQTVSEYRAWKKKHLKRFQMPAFGTLTVDHPRPLPLSAAGQ